MPVCLHRISVATGVGATGGRCPQPYHNWVLSKYDEFDKRSRGRGDMMAKSSGIYVRHCVTACSLQQ